MNKFDVRQIQRLLVAITFGGMLFNSANAGQLAPPKYQVVDEMGVNAHSGQVVVGIDTVSIGGERGLAHTVSSSTSNFIQQNTGGRTQVSQTNTLAALYIPKR